MSYQAQAGEASAVLRRDAEIPGLVRPTPREQNFIDLAEISDSGGGLSPKGWCLSGEARPVLGVARMPDGSPPCRVILIGMMGSGKTTVGQLLSRATGWPYVDNDVLVGQHVGRTSREILAAEGQGRLREAEAGALARGLALPPPVILGVAAGTILDVGNRHALEAGGVVVWLRAGTEALVGRAMDAAHRPFVDDAGKAWMADAVTEREPLYASVADLIVDTDAGTPADAVRQVRAHLASIGACEDRRRPDP